MSNTKCPCKECICLPVCKHKYIGVLFSECQLIEDYIPASSIYLAVNNERLYELEQVLNPEHWQLGEAMAGEYIVQSKVTGTYNGYHEFGTEVLPNRNFILR